MPEAQGFEGKKPVRARNLKIIDHLGTLYATFDGSKMWKMDKVSYGVWQMCDGSRTFEQLVVALSARIGHNQEDVRPVVEDILEDLTKMKFIEWID